MLIATPKRLEQFGIDLGAHWRRDDHMLPAAGARAVFVWDGEPDVVAANDEASFLSAKELAKRMQVTVQSVYQREEAHEFFAVVPPARKRGRMYPAFLLDSKLDRARLKELIELFASYHADGVTTNDLLNFLQATRDELGARTALESLLSRADDDERELVVNLAQEEIHRISQ
jgi:hypothetical protein